MDRIIKAVADETKSRGAKRVTPSHLYVSLDRADGPLRSQFAFEAESDTNGKSIVLYVSYEHASRIVVCIGFSQCNDFVNCSICFPSFEDED